MRAEPTSSLLTREFEIRRLTRRRNRVRRGGILEESLHDSREPEIESGGSNYSLADGSTRFMKVHTSLSPLNLWCITDINRLYFSHEISY